MPMNDRFRALVVDLVGAQYVPAVPVLLERSEQASREEEAYFIRRIAAINKQESLAALKAIMLRPEYRYDSWRGRHTNVTFLGIQLSNLSGAGDGILEFLRALPRTDYRRRATLIHALANMAGAHSGEPLAQSIYAALREVVFDAEDEPQVRILALDYLRKDIRLADAMQLKSRLGQEKPGLRKYFSDYLTEFF
jgi:hypothetical protein